MDNVKEKKISTKEKYINFTIMIRVKRLIYQKNININVQERQKEEIRHLERRMKKGDKRWI